MPELHPELSQFVGRCAFGSASGEVVAGVSGGADSAALLLLARASGRSVTAVHVDHGLRPNGSVEAMAVADLAEAVGAGFRAVRVEVSDGPNLEARARTARHQALGPDAALGHTADDLAETVMMRLARGSGPSGLGAMRLGPRHPILGLRRAETVAICRMCGVEPLVDPSNFDTKFTRNRVRHELLPLMSEIFERDVVVPINRTAELASEVAAAADAQALDVDPTDCRQLLTHPSSVAALALRRWLTVDGYPPSRAEVERLMAVVRGESRATELSGGRRVARSGQRLTLSDHSGAEER